MFSDYSSNPDLLDRIQDVEIRKFAEELNRRWNLLGKKVDLSKLASVGTCKDNCTSFLPMVSNITMLVPGGRFRVSFYWDTYWIILGLIASDMLETAEMLLDNFASSIHTYGFIPNGFRVYFLNRSQPPYFFLMVKAVVEGLQRKGFS
jgi:alpha,alpha-trehalase